MNDQLFELMLQKQDQIHEDIRDIGRTLQEHIEDDRQLKNEIWFVKRAFQATWGALGMGLAYLGLTKS